MAYGNEQSYKSSQGTVTECIWTCSQCCGVAKRHHEIIKESVDTKYEIFKTSTGYTLQPKGRIVDDRKIRHFNSNEWDDVNDILKALENSGFNLSDIEVK